MRISDGSPSVPQLVQDIVRVRDASGVSLPEAFERICQRYNIDASQKDDLRHAVMEYMRMIMT